jgi:hypothetical protein
MDRFDHLVIVEDNWFARASPLWHIKPLGLIDERTGGLQGVANPADEVVEVSMYAPGVDGNCQFYEL